MTTVPGALLSLIAVMLVSVQVLLIRIGMRQADTLNIVNAVLIVNTAVFVPVALIWDFPDYGLTTFGLMAFAISGIMGNLLGRWCFFHSVGLIGASRSEPIKASNPLFGVVLAIFILGESMTVLEGVGMLFVAAGAVLTSWEMASDEANQPGDFSLLYLLFPVVAALFYGAEPIFVKWGFAEGIPLMTGLSIKTLVGISFFWGFLVARGRFLDHLNIFRPDRRWFLAAAAVNTMFLFFYFGALEVAPVVLVLPILQTSPIVVALLSLIFLPRLERVTVPLIVACVAVAIGATFLSL